LLYVATQPDIISVSQIANVSRIDALYDERRSQQNIPPILQQMIREKQLEFELSVIEDNIRDKAIEKAGIKGIFYHPVSLFSMPLVLFVASTILELLSSSKRVEASRKSTIITCAGLGLLIAMAFLFGLLLR
jgi:hypothetical protein